MYDAKNNEKTLDKNENCNKCKFVLDRSFYSRVNSNVISNIKSNYVSNDGIYK
ncbi:hypothetical protein SH2C18_01840 [Clostridium sediminicola]|uniref:hypothetical protein n=1 Tax=Clostridium sediminicola TaxID=3114879 RepID=UPI0031F1D068